MPPVDRAHARSLEGDASVERPGAEGGPIGILEDGHGLFKVSNLLSCVVEDVTQGDLFACTRSLRRSQVLETTARARFEQCGGIRRHCMLALAVDLEGGRRDGECTGSDFDVDVENATEVVAVVSERVRLEAECARCRFDSEALSGEMAISRCLRRGCVGCCDGAQGVRCSRGGACSGAGHPKGGGQCDCCDRSGRTHTLHGIHFFSFLVSELDRMVLSGGRGLVSYEPRMSGVSSGSP